MAFNILPVELNGLIAENLDDRDLTAFASVCQATNDGVNHAHSSVWRTRFARHFDMIPRADNHHLKAVYQSRRKVLRHGAQFTKGLSQKERNCLKVLVELAVEAYIGSISIVKHGETRKAKNIEMMEKFAKESNLLQYVLSPQHSKGTSPLLLAIQILLTHVQLDLSFKCNTFGFPDSQRTAYSTAVDCPMLQGPCGTIVNMSFVARTINFFKHHLTRKDEHTLHADFEALEPEERPKAWRSQFSPGTNRLGTNWKGVYAYLDHDDLDTVRDSDEGETEDFIADGFNDDHNGSVFQTLKLAFPSKRYPWPTTFECHLLSLLHPSVKFLSSSSNPHTPPRKTRPLPLSRPQTRSTSPPTTSSIPTPTPNPAPTSQPPVAFQFLSTGYDSEPFVAQGWLSGLPPQHGIPGWQRWTMMKFFVDHDFLSTHSLLDDSDSYDDEDHAATQEAKHAAVSAAAQRAATNGDDLWAYEGIVLPGGELVVGRWWHPTGDRTPGIGDTGVDGDDEDAGWIYSGPFMFWCTDP